MVGWLILALLVAIFLWGVGTYNYLVSLKNEVLNGWKQIDVQLKRRYDLIPNLVETVKGVMKFEQDTLARSSRPAIRRYPCRVLQTGRLRRTFYQAPCVNFLPG